MKKKIFSIILPVFFSATISIAQQFDFNKRCVDAYNFIQALRFNEAKTLIAQEKNDNPGNLIPLFLDNYIDFISIYISEDEEEFETLEKNQQTRLVQLRKGDDDSPYYLYTQAELLIQWAFARLKFEEYVNAFTEVKKAYGLLEENQKKFPDFIANKKSLGMLHCLVGAIPDKYKWGANILGMDGTIQQGLNEMESIIAYSKTHKLIFTQETYLYYAFLSLYLQKDDVTAWNIVKDLDTKNNLINVFCVSSVAMRTGRNDIAISTLQNKPSGSNYLSYAYLDFMLGLAKMRKLDSDANYYFERFLKNFKGNNYIKEANQKLAWYYLINGNTAKYYEYMQIIKQKGEDIIDDDKQAWYEAENGKAPNVILLKSRLLFDGGYYKNALQLLEGKSTDSFSDVKDKTEFTYRAARIYHASGGIEKAKGFYAATIKNGETLTYYFAASAALQLGLIYEKEKNHEKAKIYFNICLNMDNEEYKTSLDSQAKAGLNRVGE
ncbi:MAG: tetratricopeptide repeat protein [Fimbriimonadaceae bacterium]|nr:tetratricopeptide repeat protein [Chitinophagales bacterium]